jgi:sterol desaturase/sphingolipid hydroxylase (fatty acid hydroxylase superfamily)
VAAFGVFQLVGYWAHRAQHEVPLFWRFHAVHHSSTRLDWIAGARAHPGDVFVGTLVAAPVLLVLGVDAAAVGVLGAVAGVWGIFLHANVRWRLRALDGWIGTPEYHHWHHSAHPEARNRNYAALLPVFDRLFGTYHQPADRRPETYGCDAPVPDGWWAQLRWPLRRPSRPLADAPPPLAPQGAR